jgi:hypothetical protein
MSIIEAAGFTQVQVASTRYDAFSGSPHESDWAEFETVGIVITATKPALR